jgi:hypothetical protein
MKICFSAFFTVGLASSVVLGSVRSGNYDNNNGNSGYGSPSCPSKDITSAAPVPYTPTTTTKPTPTPTPTPVIKCRLPPPPETIGSNNDTPCETINNLKPTPTPTPKPTPTPAPIKCRLPVDDIRYVTSTPTPVPPIMCRIETVAPVVPTPVPTRISTACTKPTPVPRYK